MLQLKKHVDWIQPNETAGTGTVPIIGFDEVLRICKEVAVANIRTWDDINRVDVRPSKGMLKVWSKSNWEIQIDSETGKVLQVAFRRSDLIESIHDGSWFHSSVKYGIFLPVGVGLLLLVITGIYLFALPYLARRRIAASKKITSAQS